MIEIEFIRDGIKCIKFADNIKEAVTKSNNLIKDETVDRVKIKGTKFLWFRRIKDE